MYHCRYFLEKSLIIAPLRRSTFAKNKIYKSDEACAAFLFPFKNFVFDPLIVKSQADQISEDMTELMKQVVTHTPRPEYIKEKFEITG